MSEKELKKLPFLIALGILIGTMLGEFGMSLFR